MVDRHALKRHPRCSDSDLTQSLNRRLFRFLCQMVAGTTSLGDEKPPDLWIHHHDQMELKTCKGENLPPDGVTSNRNSQDVSSIEDHYLGTLDKKKSLYMGMCFLYRLIETLHGRLCFSRQKWA